MRLAASSLSRLFVSSCGPVCLALALAFPSSLFSLHTSSPGWLVHQRVPSATESALAPFAGSPAPAFVSVAELHLARHLCQSRIDERRLPSNACTIIAALYAKSVLVDGGGGSSTAGALLTSSGDSGGGGGGGLHLTDECDRLCAVIREGNRLYDFNGFSDLLGTDRVLDLPLGVRMTHEMYARAGQYHAVENFLRTALDNSVRSLVAGVFVTNPYSFAFSFDRHHFVMFDSHEHGGEGAMLLASDTADTQAHLRHFFDTYYPTLEFSAADNCARVGHLVTLDLSSPVT